MVCGEAKSLAKAERQLAEYAMLVLKNRPLDAATRAAITVTYPQKFSLTTLTELCTSAAQVQAIVANAGEAPEVETELIQEIVHLALPGYSDADYAALDAEISAVVEAKSKIKEQYREMAPRRFGSAAEALEGDGSAEQDAGADPTGISGGTMVSNMIPSVM